MRLCVDATPLLLRSAGVKNYVYHWMRSLAAEARNLEVTAFPMLGHAGTLDHERSVLSTFATLPRIALLHFTNIRGNPAMDLLMRGVDVFHASVQVRNPPRNTLLTGTLYDLTCVLMPHFHTAANVRAEQRFYERVALRADGLIAISESTRADAIRLLGIAPERIRTIYPGIPEAFFGATAGEVPARYGLTKPYLLFVGTIEPRKNVDTLLTAYESLPAPLRARYDLVIAGPIGWASGATVERLRSGIAGVRVLGYVAEADLPALTAGATAFVYPSFYEGFGFPVAQAMAAGVPVITSNVSSLPEVAGGAGLLIDPGDTGALRDALSRLLDSAELRRALAARGMVRARMFTWKACAESSKAFFHGLP